MPDDPSDITVAHTQLSVNRYTIHYPDHTPRQGDPHYAAFSVYHRAHEKTSVCFIGAKLGFDQCSDALGKPMLDQPGHPGLELHHHFLEFAVINSVDLAAIAKDYPDLTNIEKVAAWAETDPNFMWLCAKHHRGNGGAHHASYADFEAEQYVKGLIT